MPNSWTYSSVPLDPVDSTEGKLGLWPNSEMQRGNSPLWTHIHAKKVKEKIRRQLISFTLSENT